MCLTAKKSSASDLINDVSISLRALYITLIGVHTANILGELQVHCENCSDYQKSQTQLFFFARSVLVSEYEQLLL